MGPRRTAAALTLWTITAQAHGLELEGTAYQRAAEQAGVSARLLYAVTLVESRRPASPGRIKPWPWVLRTPAGGQWYETRSAALAALEQALDQYSLYKIDVGAGQINLGWQAHRYQNPKALMGLERNLEVAAEVLADATTSTDDPWLGVGRYHTWADTSRAIAYGEWVRAIAKRIKTREKTTPEGTEWSKQWTGHLARSTSS